MVRAAAECGVDAVKFQTVRAGQLVSRKETARFERLTSFELSDAEYLELSRLAHELGLLFVSTPLYLDAVAMLEPLVDAYKIASGDNDFLPLIEKVAQTGKPVILSSGVSTLAQVEAAVATVRRIRGSDAPLGVLQCVSSYPTPPGEAQLSAIPLIAQNFRCVTGYSDHTLGIDACVLAVGAGARILEKHFTLDKNLSDFRDHALSADPAEMRELVCRVRAAEAMLGDGDKRIQPCEEAEAVTIRRSIAAARDLKQGATITASDLKWIRPGSGLRPGQEAVLIGRRLRRDLAADELLSESDVE
ncbi:MAG: N-acetylneuraminate synthase family protein [Planctomycetaceae bacterium]